MVPLHTTVMLTVFFVIGMVPLTTPSLTDLPLTACQHIRTPIAPTYRIFTDVISGVVLENTGGIKCIL